jgi:hypothetical protein
MNEVLLYEKLVLTEDVRQEKSTALMLIDFDMKVTIV